MCVCSLCSLCFLQPVNFPRTFICYYYCHRSGNTFSHAHANARCSKRCRKQTKVSKPTSNPLDKRLSKFTQIQCVALLYPGTLTFILPCIQFRPISSMESLCFVWACVYFLSSIHFHSPVLHGVMTTSWHQWLVYHKRLFSSYLHVALAHTHTHNRILKLNIDSWWATGSFWYIWMCVYGIGLLLWFIGFFAASLLIRSHTTLATRICHSLLRIYSRHTHAHTRPAHIFSFWICLWCFACCCCCFNRLYLDETVVLLPGYLFVHARSMSRMKKTWHTHVHVYDMCVASRSHFFLSFLNCR